MNSKLMPFYTNKMVKNMYQPFYDIINAQSIWTDAMSQWFTKANENTIKMINDQVKSNDKMA